MLRQVAALCPLGFRRLLLLVVLVLLLCRLCLLLLKLWRWPTSCRLAAPGAAQHVLLHKLLQRHQLLAPLLRKVVLPHLHSAAIQAQMWGASIGRRVSGRHDKCYGLLHRLETHTRSSGQCSAAMTQPAGVQRMQPQPTSTGTVRGPATDTR